jgi:hypothetical protein
MDEVQIYEWLKAQKYQTDYEETGEYKMYFEIDMPKILEDYYNYKLLQQKKSSIKSYVGDKVCNFCGNNIEFPNKRYTVGGKPACLSCSLDDDEL